MTGGLKKRKPEEGKKFKSVVKDDRGKGKVNKPGDKNCFISPKLSMEGLASGDLNSD